MPNNTSALARLATAANRMAAEAGLEYVDTELVKEPSGKFLRIYVDKEGGITLNELEAFHRSLLKLTDDIDYDYMEVSSPGADRPLKTERDFEKALGKTVELKLYKPQDGKKQFLGTLTGFENGLISVEVGEETLSFEQKSVAIIRPFVDVDKELEQSRDI